MCAKNVFTQSCFWQAVVALALLPPGTSSTKLLAKKAVKFIAIPVGKAIKTKAALVQTAAKLPVELFKSKVSTVSRVIKTGNKNNKNNRLKVLNICQTIFVQVHYQN